MDYLTYFMNMLSILQLFSGLKTMCFVLVYDTKLQEW